MTYDEAIKAAAMAIYSTRPDGDYHVRLVGTTGTYNDWQQVFEPLSWEDANIGTREYCIAAVRAAAPILMEYARIAALEEAARVAEAVGRAVGAGDGETRYLGTSWDAAAAIRALIPSPDARP